ncbi:unnamed protein product [Heterobilharzia americana]|nr:unnamed protein product [Heterobilharzia americana]
MIRWNSPPQQIVSKHSADHLKRDMTFTVLPKERINFPDTVGFGEDLLPTDLDSFFELEKDSHGEIGKQDLFATAPTQNGENQVSKCLIPEDIALEECPTVNRLVAMDESERVSSGVYGSSVQPIPPFQISPLRPVESVNVCSRKRGAGKKVAKKLIIDKDTRITSSEMRWNMLHSEQTIGRRNDILAESRSRSQVQYLLSRNLTRLFALPANLETALSSKLSEFWVRQRRVCEVALKQKISNGEIKDDLEEDELFRIPSMNESSSSMGTSTVREDNDASIEFIVSPGILL